MPDQSPEATPPTKKKKSKVTMIIVISILAVLLLGGGGSLAYYFMYVPGKVTNYRNEIVDIHNEMVETVDDMNVITDNLNKGEANTESLDEYVVLSDNLISLIGDLEAVDQYDRNNEALKNFNSGIDDLIVTSKETEKVERDIAMIMKEMVRFYQCGEDVVAATEAADPKKPDTFEKALSDYDSGMQKCGEAIKNLELAKVTASAETAAADTVGYFQEIETAYNEMKTALEKSQRSISQNNYNLSLEAVNDIEEIGKKLENTTWPASLTALLDLESQVVDDLNQSFEDFQKYDDELILEWGITAE